MSVIIMLAFLWWGLIGFLAFSASVFGMFAQIRESFGLKGLWIAFTVTTLGVAALWVHAQGNEERTAQGFIYSWSQASNDYPAKGRMNTPEMTEFLDMDKVGSISGYFPKRIRIIVTNEIFSVGEETIRCVNGSMAATKVFKTDIVILNDNRFYEGVVKMWVEKKTDLICRFTISDVDVGAIGRRQEEHTEDFADRLREAKWE